jgi:hypothetical protein
MILPVRFTRKPEIRKSPPINYKNANIYIYQKAFNIESLFFTFVVKISGNAVKRQKKRCVAQFHMYRYFHIVFFIQTVISVYAQDFTSSDLPIVFIDTYGQEIPDEPKILAHMGIIYNGEGEMNYITDAWNEYNGRISIEIRGSTSQNFPKKQYGFETQDDEGDNLNVSLLGMPPENDWILYAPYTDKTLIRNALAYHLYGMLGHYSPRTRFCEVLLNDEYQGVYLLIEKIKRDRNRVNISSMGTDDIQGDELTGGYIIKMDKETGDTCDNKWASLFEGVYLYHYPDCDEVTIQQENYIKGFIQEMEETFNKTTYADPIVGYRKYIDVASYIDYFIINEMGKNIDAYTLSTFFYKDRSSIDDKLKIGPVWDFNLAFGNADYRGGYDYHDLVAPSYTLWTKLLNDTTFFNELTDRWRSLREDIFSDDNLMRIVDSLVGMAYAAHDRNFERWDIIGARVWPNYFVGETYYDEVLFMKDWLMQRVYWLDEYFLNISKKYEPFRGFETDYYPNPFSDIFNYEIRFDKPAKISLKLYNVYGHLESILIDNELCFPYKKQVTRDVKELKNGLYYLILELDNSVVSRTKVIKIN